MHKFDKVVEDHLLKEVSVEAAQNLKSSRFYGWLQARCNRFLDRHYDRQNRCYKGNATVE